MNWTASSLTSSSALASGALKWVAAVLLAGCASIGSRPGLGDDFRQGLSQWHIEAEQPARVEARDGVLDIDSPAGITLWFKHRLQGPVRIRFDATAVAEGGRNDQVSDLNVFWMASNRDGTQPVYARARTGRFSDYNDLLTYYVGLGGNRNTTTRFRRYIGDPVQRPLLPEHDLSAPDTLLIPNVRQTITLVADGRTIEYWRDGRRLFSLEDAAPYESGWFGLRTTLSHLRIEKLRVVVGADAAATNR